jgi:hypothetical protein
VNVCGHCSGSGEGANQPINSSSFLTDIQEKALIVQGFDVLGDTVFRKPEKKKFRRKLIICEEDLVVGTGSTALVCLLRML